MSVTFIISSDHAFISSGVLGVEPLQHFGVVGSRGKQLPDFRPFDPLEAKKHVVQGTVEVVRADGPGDVGPAFVDHPGHDDVAADSFLRAAG